MHAASARPHTSSPLPRTRLVQQHVEAQVRRIRVPSKAGLALRGVVSDDEDVVCPNRAAEHPEAPFDNGRQSRVQLVRQPGPVLGGELIRDQMEVRGGVVAGGRKGERFRGRPILPRRSRRRPDAKAKTRPLPGAAGASPRGRG